MSALLREPSARASNSQLSRLGPPDGSPSIEPYAPCMVCRDRRPPLAELHRDPFCTNKCARVFYGCPLDPATERPERRAA